MEDLKLKAEIESKVHRQGSEFIDELKRAMDSASDDDYTTCVAEDVPHKGIKIDTIQEYHGRETRELKEQNARLKADLDDYIQQTEYWYRHYQSVVQENEKYKMAFDRLWDIVEDMK